MLNISRSGRIADVIAQARDIPSRVIPYAAATALTRTASEGQKGVVAQMPRVFDRPTRYTLNALRIEGATKDKLVASVQVKSQAASGTRPESYLLPEVQGGPRREKRFEKALRLSGLLRRGQYAVPALGAQLDASGNVSRATISQILAALKAVRGGVTGKGQRKGQGRRLKNDLFVGAPSVGSGAGRRARAGAQAGIYRREGMSGAGADRRGRLRLLFAFSSQAPNYRKRLDFDGIVSAVVRDRFAVEFERAAASILAKRR